MLSTLVTAIDFDESSSAGSLIEFVRMIACTASPELSLSLMFSVIAVS